MRVAARKKRGRADQADGEEGEADGGEWPGDASGGREAGEIRDGWAEVRDEVLGDGYQETAGGGELHRG